MDRTILFRNRAEKYGIYINLGAGNGMNLIANEIPHNSGIISTFGSDHFCMEMY